jgi:hypothetical protein
MLKAKAEQSVLEALTKREEKLLNGMDCFRCSNPHQRMHHIVNAAQSMCLRKAIHEKA